MAASGAATLLQTMGKVFYGLGLYERSVALLQEALKHAVTNPLSTRLKTQVALGDALYVRGDYEAAQARYRAVSDALMQKPWSAERSAAANGLADVMTQNADYQSAIGVYRDALEQDIAKWGERDVHSARTSAGLATAQLYSGDNANAEVNYTERSRPIAPHWSRPSEGVGDDQQPGSSALFRGDAAGAATYYREPCRSTKAVRQRPP